MEKQMRWSVIIAAMLLAVLICVSAGAEVLATGDSDDVTWTLEDNGTLTISGTGAMTDYSYDNPAPWRVYQEQIKTVAIESGVTTIGKSAFENCNVLSQVSIPATVTSIGDMAFGWCSGLAELQIPDGVTMLGSDLFYYSGLTSLDIPASVSEIGEFSFASSQSLREINVADGNEFFTSVDGVLFTRDMGTLLAYPGGKEGDYTVPESVHTIHAGAFSGSSGIGLLIVPGTVKTIERFAFHQCKASEIALGNGIKTIGVSAFNSSFISMDSISIPASVEEIGACAFYLSFLGNVYVDAENAYYASIDGALYNKDLTRLFYFPLRYGFCSLPESVKTIEQDAFAYNLITGVMIPDGLTEINEEAFLGCNSMTEISMPTTVKSIGLMAFEGCDALTDVYFAGTQEEWEAIRIHEDGNSALYGATMHMGAIGSISGECMDWGWPTGASWKLDPDTGVLTVYGEGYIPDNYSFNASGGILGSETLVSKVSSIVIEEGVTKIGMAAFTNMPNLVNLSFPDSLTEIGMMAFLGCGKINEVTLPAGLTDFGNKPFFWATTLEAIHVAEGNETYVSVDGVLYSKDMSTLVCIPSGYIKELQIPASVTKIADGAICDCWNFPDIVIPANVTEIGMDNFNSVTVKSLAVEAGNEAYEAEDGVIFSKGMNTLLWYPKASETTIYRVPYGVKAIGENVFQSCDNLREVYLPYTLESIGMWAFDNNFLRTISIPPTVKHIDNNAIPFPEESNVVIKCRAYSEAAKYAQLKNIPWEPLWETVLELPEGIITIESEAFAGLPYVDVIKIPESVASIAEDAFDEGVVLLVPEGSKWIEWANEHRLLPVTQGE